MRTKTFCIKSQPLQEAGAPEIAVKKGLSRSIPAYFKKHGFTENR
jgi:hypothetical protein